jgi:hypothetical protein
VQDQPLKKVEHPVWIYAKDRAPFVRDRQIKKVRVVSFDEKEAGLKRLKTSRSFLRASP